MDDYRKAFDKFDTDGSGHLGAADFASFEIVGALGTGGSNIEMSLCLGFLANSKSMML